MELFEYLNAMTKDNKELDFDDEEIKKNYNNFIINRFVSMAEAYIPLVNEINQYDLPKSVHYRYFWSALPKKNHYFKYIKKGKDLDIDEKKYIAEYFEVGLKDAERYIEILNEQQIAEILKVFKFGRK
jgi:hypothetical protein